MDVQSFLAKYPPRGEESNKYTDGQTLLIGGSKGMAGAVCLNIYGAMTAGSRFITCAMDEAIYPIAASRFISTVFFPMNKEAYAEEIRKALERASAVSFGSGVDKLSYRKGILDLLLSECKVPLLLDANALRMVSDDLSILKKAQCPLILTPHTGEFSALTSISTKDILKNPVEIGAEFAKKYGIYLVLKNHVTRVFSPTGEIYINDTGNRALAQAGSGDVLNGIITGLVSITKDPWNAAKMGVWLHGYLADLSANAYSQHTFPLEVYPSLMNRFLLNNKR
ncbi:MAG: NAD(P)H-hydrate dehydratase [Oscillospiraceae bacterium]|nr:NAD(P)H-hydrate dehydratase [Oscillospiraceae bacterium]